MLRVGLNLLCLRSLGVVKYVRYVSLHRGSLPESTSVVTQFFKMSILSQIVMSRGFSFKPRTIYVSSDLNR